MKKKDSFNLKRSILSVFFGILCFGVAAQHINVSGIVSDTYGEPLVGVTLQVRGLPVGTVTDIDGNFTLSDISADAVLEVSYVGMTTQVVSVNGRRVVNITLQEDSELLSEVVVTGFGLAQRKESLTSAISVIGAEDISRSKASTSSGALVGKIAGINSRQVDGRPGASTSIQIRNMGTPLFVIDGIQSDEGQFNNIDFNDIETISVLKDASASIYGVRAANGVVVVTTKKGLRNTKNTVTLNTYYGWQSLYDFPKPADAMTYIRNHVQAETIQGASAYKFTPEDYEKWQQGTEKGFVPFDWYDYIWKVSPQTYVNVSMSGGSDKINYYLSVGNLKQDAIIVNYGGFNRTNVQMNVNANVSDRLKIGGGMNGRIERRVNPGVPEADDYWMPRFGTYRNLPTARPYVNDNPLYPAVTSSVASTNFAMLNYDVSGRFEETWRVVQLNLDAEYEIFDGLKARALASYYLANQRMDNQEYTYKLYKYDEKTDTYPVDFENTNPWRERRQGFVEEMTSNVQLSYGKKFDRHNVAAVFGMEAIRRDTPTTWVHAIPTANALHLIDYQILDTYDDSGNNTQARLGYMGRINYDFANKYLLELSGRYDGSWKFPPNHRWGFFPSGSVGWRISEENFWRDGKISRVFEDLKLRASYGFMGDDNVNDYGAFDYVGGYTYKKGGSVIDGVYTLGTEPRGLPVTTLSWIKAESFDAALDAAFLKGKLTGSIDFFRRMRTGLPASRYDILLPSEVGFSLPRENLNSDMHMGYDLALNWNDKVNELTYSIGANATYSRFYDWEQYKPRFGNSWHVYRNSINHRFGYLNWGLEADGQFRSWEEIASWPVDNDRRGNTTLRPGDIKYKDVNGDGVINGMDERPIGYRQDSTPVLNFGFNFSFLWKGFDLSFDLTGGAMSTWYQEWEQRNPFHDGGNNPQYYMEDTWRLADIWNADSELIPGKYPMLLIGNSGHSNYWNSTFWKKNVKYIKMRNLEFGYTIPQSVARRASVSEMRLYLAGQNLFGLTNLIGVDPEINETNGLAYPTMRIINVGLTVKF
ncbi:MAG: TonB-dependent receptor [Proteiniphilum sp.]|jgi:TonB-linked SusC/RagA family outer membrane protein|nr:TonB-dependent receptor [Proteiniphilum sp.]